MLQMIDIIREHPFFQDLTSENLAFVAGCGKNVVFKEGEVIATPGNFADVFYLIRDGQVSIFLEMTPNKPFICQTLGKNDVLGWSWLIPPYRWTVAARAVHTTHAIALDGACIRKKCEEDPALGFKLMKHLVKILVAREDATRLRLLDVYGNP